MKETIKSLFRSFGYELVPRALAESKGLAAGFPPDFDQATIDLFRSVEPYTMTSKERVFALRRSVEYIAGCAIPGAVVECGVWRGGSSMAMASTLMELGSTERTLYLFDTFEGMPPPGAEDLTYRGEPAEELMTAQNERQAWVQAYSPLEAVKAALATTRYPSERLVFVKGRVEETIPKNAPATIALLRLDTDWYESTYHELKHLYPRLSIGGVLIIDDYGHWKGARKAVDQFMEEQKPRLLLSRIDYTARMAVKLEP